MTNKLDDFFQCEGAVDLPEFEEDLSWANYAFVVEDMNGEVVHICAYPSQPTEIDKEHLISELMFDPTFGMMNEVHEKDYIIRDATQSEMSSFKAFLRYRTKNID